MSKGNPNTTEVILGLDEDDIRDFKRAVEKRLSWALDGRMAMPPGAGSLESRAIGEICRGWLESLWGDGGAM